MELPQNLWHTFACVASGKKNFLPKMELPQNLWHTFACVASGKNKIEGTPILKLAMVKR